MTLLSIDLREPAVAPPTRNVGGGRIVFGSTNLTRGSVPGRGLLYSFLLHEFALFSLVTSYSYRVFTVPPTRPPEEFRMVYLHEASPVVYLPNLGGGSEGIPRPARRAAPRHTQRPEAASSSSPRSTSGLIYPGPQPIVSDVPKPTNTVQTILQPELKNPPIIKPYVPLPNIVEIAQAAPPPPPAPQPPPRVVVPDVHVVPEKPPEAPNLKLPGTAPRNLSVMPSAKPPEPRIVAPAADLDPEKLPMAPNLKLPKTAPKNLPVMPNAKPPEPRVVVPVIPPIENLKSKIENPLETPKLEVPTAPVHSLSVMPSAKPPEPRPVVPVVHFESEKTPEAPKLRLPPTGPANLSAMPVARPPEKPLESAARARGDASGQLRGGLVGGTPGSTGHASQMPTEGKDARNLLALSPMPAPTEGSLKVPLGEARGRFAISPEASQGDANVRPGSKTGSAPSSAVGIGQGSGTGGGPVGSKSGAPGGIALGLPAREGEATAGGSGGAAAPSSSGAGSGGKGSRLGQGPTGTGSGRGLTTAAGRGTGLGTGTGPGSGSGVGAVNSGGAFPGISIQGGSLRSGTAAKPSAYPNAPEPPKRSYSLTIVSTSSSGGGLADFGVFRNERVYTVYLDMRHTLEDPAPSWTLQYAILRGAEGVAGVAGSPITIQPSASSEGEGQGLVPPFPLVKEQPHFPLDLALRYQRRLIVIYAVINKEGKFEHLLVKQSPNAQLNGPLLEALDKWVFRPAELNGEKVSVKTLLGIPVIPPQ